MIFRETELPGAFVVDLEPLQDERGFFARAWSASEFAERGLSSSLVQANIAFNHRRGTVRGLHYQVAPHAEDKLVRCTRGAIFDVAVDLRPDSPTYMRWTGVELSAENRTMLYVPKGCAHGYQTLEDETEALYHVTAAYEPAAERGLRWDDPAIGIAWRDLGEPILSEKDRSWPLSRR